MDVQTDVGGDARTLLVMGDRHHRSWVGPPEWYDRIGALQFVVLILLGMREYHRLLDIGCGSLRGGRLSMMYLNEGNYYGIEPEQWVLNDGVAYEVSDGLVALKKPTFSHASDFAAGEFGVTFDFVLGSGLFMHAAASQIRQCFRNVADVLAPEGLFLGAYIQGDVDSDHDSWTYPNIQRYTSASLVEMANFAALRLTFVDWPHPFGHKWFVAHHETSREPVPMSLDLSAFTWTRYLQDQISERGGRRRTYTDYLKEDLKRRISPEEAPRVLPQVFF